MRYLNVFAYGARTDRDMRKGMVPFDSARRIGPYTPWNDGPLAYKFVEFFIFLFIEREPVEIQ